MSQSTFHKIQNIFYTSINRRLLELFLICVSIAIIYLCLNSRITTKIIQIQSKPNQMRLNAYIITENCTSLRFNTTKENIQRVFPNFFTILCYLFVPLNDSRIHTASVPLWKKFSSNLLTFIDIWTYKIPNDLNSNEYEWTFIFEDDVNFVDPSKVSLLNYITTLQELMYNKEIQSKHGFLYLGICGPTFDNDNQTLISKNTNNSLFSEKAFGYCLHATGITKRRSRLFWAEISSYRPNPGEQALDVQLRSYCIRSNNHFYTMGSNFHFPPDTGHYGIAYQDRGRFSTTIEK